MITFLNYTLSLVASFLSGDYWLIYILPIICIGILCCCIKVIYSLINVFAR